jgi:outer membrane scaffolding protein for murein synthesis (MipA/OmpV family)
MRTLNLLQSARNTIIASLVLTGAGAMPHAKLEAQRDSPPSWDVQLGTALIAVPSYAGADEYRIRVIPLAAVEYRERYFVGESRTGLDVAAGAYLLRGSSLRWTVEVGPSQLRAHLDADGLAGMDRTRTDGYAGTAIAYALGPLEASASVAVGAKQRHDVQGELGLATAIPLAPRWLLNVSTSASFGDADNMAAEHGITIAEAQRRADLLTAGDGRLRAGEAHAFSPRGGLKRMSAQMAVMRPVTEQLALLTIGQVSRLQGDAAASPLTRRRTSFVAGAGVVYQMRSR